MKGNFVGTSARHTLRGIILALVLCAHPDAAAASDPYGVRGKLVVPGGQPELFEASRALLNLRLPEGRYRVRLERKEVQEGVALFRAQVKGHAGAAFRRGAVDYDRDVLRVYLETRRGRFTVLNLRLYGTDLVGRVARLSRGLRIPCGVRQKRVQMPPTQPPPLARATMTLPEFPRASQHPARGALYAPPLYLELDLEVDAEFLQAFQGSKRRASRYITSVFHAVNEIYGSQLGIGLVPVRRTFHSSQAEQPFSARNAEVLVDQLRRRGRKRRAQRADVRFLFTGKDTGVGGDSSVIGIAYTGVVCSNPGFSVGFVEKTAMALQVVVTAHELGHLLGALHDPGPVSLMAPVARAALTTFSDQSLGEIASHVDPHRQCLEESRANLELSVRAPGRSSLQLVTELVAPARTACEVKVWGLQSRRDRGGVLLESFVGQGVLARKSRARKLSLRPDARVFVQAEASCGGETLRSRVVAVPRGRLRGRREPSSTFFEELARALVLQ